MVVVFVFIFLFFVAPADASSDVSSVSNLMTIKKQRAVIYDKPFIAVCTYIQESVSLTFDVEGRWFGIGLV